MIIWHCPSCQRIKATPENVEVQYCHICNTRMVANLNKEGKTMTPEPEQKVPLPTEAPPEEELAAIPPDFPGGGRVAGGLPEWFPDFTKGQQVTGILVGTMDIKEKRRWRFRLGGKTGKEYVLPDHVDLDRKLEDVFNVNGPGARVVILYRGRAKIEGVATPMMQYHVADFGVEK